MYILRPDGEMLFTMCCALIEMRRMGQNSDSNKELKIRSTHHQITKLPVEITDQGEVLRHKTVQTIHNCYEAQHKTHLLFSNFNFNYIWLSLQLLE